MREQWMLTTEFTFDAAHFIEGYNGPCGRMHGHTYRVRITAKGDRLSDSEYCPSPVMLADYKTLKWAKQDVSVGGLDHCCLNDVMPYATTAELIAKYIHEETQKRIPSCVSLVVAVSETAGNWAEYSVLPD